MVPVYNAELYIENCIKSLFRQTHSDIEIIAVDDGSTDGSYAKLRALQRCDRRLTIIRQPNQGVSAARNEGLRAARGKYVGFVDSDDHVESRMFETMWKVACREKSDIVVCGCTIHARKSVSNSGFGISKTYDLQNLDMQAFLREVYLSTRYRMSCWNKLYSRNILDAIGGFVSYGEVISEDTLFNYRALFAARRISIVPNCLYHHVLRDNSLSRPEKHKMVSERTANMVSQMWEVAVRSGNPWARRLAYYYYLKGFSIIAELERNENLSTRQDLSHSIARYRERLHSSMFLQASDLHEAVQLSKGLQRAYYFLLASICKHPAYLFLIPFLDLRTLANRLRKACI